ncbi:MAG: hypothetical protein ACRDZW_06600 [Acidimicrobiales bacterium]
MERQLELLDRSPDDAAYDWRLDDETRRRGLAGVAAARGTLANTRRPLAA